MTQISDPSDACFDTVGYLKDFPQHQKVFHSFGVAREHTMNGDCNNLLVQVTSLQATIQLFKPGGLKKQLGFQIAATCKPHEDLDGRFIVKIDCATKNLGLLNVGSLLAMLGHFSEQTASNGLYILGVHALRNTSFDAVYGLLFNSSGVTESDAGIRDAADTICAWANAIFICYATGLPIAHVAVGMALDGCRNHLVGEFLQDYGQQLYKLAEERRATISEQVLAGVCGPELCKSIDMLTRSAFSHITPHATPGKI